MGTLWVCSLGLARAIEFSYQQYLVKAINTRRSYMRTLAMKFCRQTVNDLYWRNKNWRLYGLNHDRPIHIMPFPSRMANPCLSSQPNPACILSSFMQSTSPLCPEATTSLIVT